MIDEEIMCQCHYALLHVSLAFSELDHEHIHSIASNKNGSKYYYLLYL